MDLPLSDKLLLIKHYFQSSESVTAALRGYHYEKNIRDKSNQLPHSTVDYLIKKFLETGSLNKSQPPGRNNNDQYVSIIENALPVKSVRSMSSYCGVPKSTVHRILRNTLNMFPYKTQYVHYIPPSAVTERMEFCQKLLRTEEESPGFLDSVLFTDEATFDVNPHLNKQNDRIWSSKSEGPPSSSSSVTFKHFPKKICVWAGFTSKFSIGPFFFDTTVNSENYGDMLLHCVIPALKAKRKFNSTVFQQDGATPHTAVGTKQLLRKMFGEDRVISRGFPFAWPGYSPDLTPADFGLWPTLKSRVNTKNFESIHELKDAIEIEFNNLPVSFFANCVQSVPARCVLCIENGGSNF